MLGIAFGMQVLAEFPEVAEKTGLVTFVPPRFLGYYTAGIAAITLMARIRSIVTVKVKPVSRDDDAPHDRG
jgi:hypothetical protein